MSIPSRIIIVTFFMAFSLYADYQQGYASPFSRLGISPQAEVNTINKQCRRLMFQYHPDKYHTEREKQQAHAIFIQVNNDCELVKNFSRSPSDEESDSSYGGEKKQEEYTWEEKMEWQYWKDYFERQKANNGQKTQDHNQQQHTSEEKKSEEKKEEHFFHWEDGSWSGWSENQRSTHDKEYASYQTIINNASAVQDLTIRRSYFGLKCKSPWRFYGTATCLPFFTQESQKHGTFYELYRSGGMLFDFFGGFDFLWAELTLSLNNTRNIYAHINASKTGITESAFSCGTLFGSPEGFQFNPYFFMLIPGQYAHIKDYEPETKHHALVIAGNPFFAPGLGLDLSYNIIFTENFQWAYFINIRWYKTARRSFMLDNQTLDVESFMRIDTLVGLNFFIKKFVFELGYGSMATSDIHTLSNKYSTIHNDPRFQIYFMGNYTVHNITFGGGFNITLDPEAHKDQHTLTGGSGWLNCMVTF